MAGLNSFGCDKPDCVEGSSAKVENCRFRAIAEKVAQRVLDLAVRAQRRGELLVFLGVPWLLDFVKDEANAARFLRWNLFVEVEDFGAEVVRGIAIEMSV